MKGSRLSKFLDYIPPVVAFAAAVGAIAGAPKWDGRAIGLAKVTPLGWVVLCIGLTALVSSMLVTRRNHRDQKAQKAVRQQIAIVGQEQILRGLDRIVCVFRHSSFWHHQYPEPASPLDLLSPERRSALASLNLNALSPYADGKGPVKWWVMFEDTAKQGAAQITAALQIYVTFLDPKVIENSTKLLNCEFLRVRLHHIQDIIDANTRGDPERAIRFFWVGADEMHNAGYEEFWNLVSQVLRLCAPAPQSDQVNWFDPPERSVS